MDCRTVSTIPTGVSLPDSLVITADSVRRGKDLLQKREPPNMEWFRRKMGYFSFTVHGAPV